MTSGVRKLLYTVYIRFCNIYQMLLIQVQQLKLQSLSVNLLYLAHYIVPPGIPLKPNLLVPYFRQRLCMVS